MACIDAAEVCFEISADPIPTVAVPPLTLAETIEAAAKTATYVLIENITGTIGRTTTPRQIQKDTLTSPGSQIICINGKTFSFSWGGDACAIGADPGFDLLYDAGEGEDCYEVFMRYCWLGELAGAKEQFLVGTPTMQTTSPAGDNAQYTVAMDARLTCEQTI